MTKEELRVKVTDDLEQTERSAPATDHKAQPRGFLDGYCEALRWVLTWMGPPTSASPAPAPSPHTTGEERPAREEVIADLYRACPFLPGAGCRQCRICDAAQQVAALASPAPRSSGMPEHRAGWLAERLARAVLNGNGSAVRDLAEVLLSAPASPATPTTEEPPTCTDDDLIHVDPVTGAQEDSPVGYLRCPSGLHWQLMSEPPAHCPAAPRPGDATTKGDQS